MATFATITTGTDATEILPAEEIQQQILVENRAPMVALLLSWVFDFDRKGASKTQNIPRLKTVASRTQSAEGDELTADDMDFDEESITPTTHYSYRVITWQAEKDAIFSLLGLARSQGVRAILNGIDVAGLSTFQNAIASYGSSSVALDLDAWGAALAVHRALNPQTTGLDAFVGHSVAINHLRSALRKSGAALEAGGRALPMLANYRGPVSEFEGVTLFESPNVAEVSSAKQNAFLSAGEGGALAYGVWDPIVGVPPQSAIENLANKNVVWARSGWALSTNGEASTGADSSITKVLTKTT